ncbi:type II toxin-antitoxin system PemK/MazF family toxin [Lysinibacillus sp. A4]|uniref:type II toxin-antitoxin system PemK/MazF family toxin n=1 Tax=unclassified Lysinibacillus TaxID=2636778 RepID=UPI001ED9D0C0|nr:MULTISPECIES: type II toxin-antitoxin system PemK/MazF family toxin [unclassified Lysinibacillus]MCS5500860.1 type II toxin-antitoxin system PemK/MazF family toxin [Lysinibacillus sp. A4]UKJ44275.1 type II toxin-antitoxin system PemK/MazF family toxin [Lysinibacillus sp. ACHW1.5]
MTLMNNTQKLDEWTQEKKVLVNTYNGNPESYKEMTINRGDIYLCKIGENIGEEQNNDRPVIVLSKTFYNNVSTQITVAPLSTTIRYKTVRGKRIPRIKTQFILKKSDYPFLTEDSCIKCEQIRSLSKVRLAPHKLGTVDQEALNKIMVRVKDLFDI